MKRFMLLALVLLFAISCQSNNKEVVVKKSEDMEILFVGTYTKKEGHVDGQGEGIYMYEMNKKTGALRYLGVSDQITSPSYLAVHENGKWVYAVNEYDGGEESFASVTALEFSAEDNSLKYLNEVSSMGQYPCYITIDNSGGFVMAANYVGGSVVLYPIQEDGLLLPHSSYKKHEGSSSHPRQDAAHAHQIFQHPTKDWVAAVDLGADRIYEYKLDTLSLTLDYVGDFPNSPRMSGPRHMALHPTLEIGYMLNELIGTVEVFPTNDEVRFRRSLQMISTQVEGDEREPASAAIKVHPNGKFLYASNRGEINEIVVFAIDESGTLSVVGRQSTLGEIPRDFEIDPSGRFLLAANQNTNTIVTFAIDQETGALSETGFVAEVPTPVCLKFWTGN
ncbi:lactonase family protein [Roseivirga sp.]|uniref:lactonase family protein n=1 Tax=Roseivirga sp. TaxID=1964215 RepID=UPI003B8E3F39